MKNLSDQPRVDLNLRMILPWSLLFLLLSNLPYLAAWLGEPEGKIFVGTFVNLDDFSTYLSAIRQGAEGHWLFHFPFSPEPWQPKLMLVPYLLAGRLMALFGGNGLFWFHLLRLTAVCFTLIIILDWVRVVFPGRARLQFTGWLLIVFGSGIGWMVSIFGLSSWLGRYTLDLGGPEWSLFMVLFHTPHFALGLGLEILLFICVINLTHKEDENKWIVWGMLLGSASGLTYVYHIPVTGFVIGSYLIAIAWQRRCIPWRIWAKGALVLLPLAVLLIYYAILSNQDPYFADYARFEHIIPPPPVLAVVIGMGFLGLLALVALGRWFASGYTWFVPLWAGGNLLLLYLSIIQFSGRFALGLMVPVATMAAFAVEEVALPWLSQRPFYLRFSQWTPTPYASLRRVFYILVIPSTIIMSFLLVKTAVTVTDYPTYLPQGEVSAATWLGQETDSEDLVLAYYPMGNFLPRQIPGKVFVGQFDYTTDFEEKLALSEQFWQAETSSDWRLELIHSWGIDYIYMGRYETSLSQDPINPPGNVVYDNDGVQIYRIKP